MSKNYAVIKFKQLPWNEMDQYQCVPTSWIKCYNDDNQITVAYPPQWTPALDKLIKNGKDSLQRWPLFPAVYVDGLDSYMDWMKMLKFPRYSVSEDTRQVNNNFNQRNEQYENKNHEDVPTGKTGDSSDRKTPRASGSEYQRGPQGPSTSRQHETFSLEDSNESTSIGKISKPQWSTDPDHENEVQQLKDPKKSFFEEINLEKRKSSSVQPQDLVQLRNLCRKMYLLIENILDSTQDG